MPTVRMWKNVAVAMQSALGAAKTITGITKASPGVVTSTSHGFANGAYVVLTIQGMHQLNGRVARVANQAANTFELEGIDTTLFETFSSGTAEEITFGTTLSTMTTVNASGGDFDFEDTTTIHVGQKTQIPALANPSTLTFDNLWDMSDAGLTAMKTASDAQAQRAFKFTFGTGGPIWTFTGYVGFTGSPTGQAQGKVTSPAVITAHGVPTTYSS